MTAGQPTKYKEEYCELAIELAEKGKTHIQICAHIGISERTLYNWRHTYPQFLQALSRAKAVSRSKLLDIAFANLENRNFNTNLLKLILENYNNHHLNRLKSTDALEQIKEIFEQYTNGLITIEVAERSTRLIAFRLDEKTRREIEESTIRLKNAGI